MMNAIQELNQFVATHVERGACKCGHCCDGVSDPANAQPKGHTVNLTFFEVSVKNDPTTEQLTELVKKALPELLDGSEYNYIQLGGDLGDQGAALMLIGLGDLLGLWKALSPDTTMPFLDEGTKKMMAGQGMVALMKQASEPVAHPPPGGAS